MRVLGLLALVLIVGSYIYYCSWLLLKPFLPEDHYSYYYFPDQKYVYYLPSLFLLLILAMVMSTLGYILINSEAFSKPQMPPWAKYGYQGPKISHQ
ncbi:unnamed protein product [Paramecium octaurelia]|uniref:Dolichol phosphate-mannose biosynthesis regulatory protein n=1 Tax=Paramecium octaurelia TaxID=43137 RepID=A0A8S1S4W6_PAROT|nr:unnamed protein product [Paramecium octaurelia]